MCTYVCACVYAHVCLLKELGIAELSGANTCVAYSRFLTQKLHQDHQAGGKGTYVSHLSVTVTNA